MDFRKYDVVKAAETGAILYLRDPATGEPLGQENPETGEPEGAWIKLMGTDSTVYKNAIHSRLNKRLNQKKQKDVDIAVEEKSTLVTLAKMTIDWSEETGIDGELLECTQQNAVRLYREFPWVKEQVDEFVAERSNFLNGALKA